MLPAGAGGSATAAFPLLCCQSSDGHELGEVAVTSTRVEAG